METILRKCRDCGLEAKTKNDLLLFVTDNKKINNYKTKPWCKNCDSKKRKNGKVYGPNLIKRCRDCKTFPINMDDLDKRFVKDKSMTLGYGNLCKKCNNRRVVKHSKERPDLFKNRLKKYSITKYGITVEKYNKMIEDQDNKCLICKKDFSETGKRPGIDHDHSCCPTYGYCCGKCVRGILCNKCNQAIGLFKDNIKNLENAIIYLKRR